MSHQQFNLLQPIPKRIKDRFFLPNGLLMSKEQVTQMVIKYIHSKCKCGPPHKCHVKSDHFHPTTRMVTIFKMPNTKIKFSDLHIYIDKLYEKSSDVTVEPEIEEEPENSYLSNIKVMCDDLVKQFQKLPEQINTLFQNYSQEIQELCQDYPKQIENNYLSQMSQIVISENITSNSEQEYGNLLEELKSIENSYHTLCEKIGDIDRKHEEEGKNIKRYLENNHVLYMKEELSQFVCFPSDNRLPFYVIEALVEQYIEQNKLENNGLIQMDNALSLALNYPASFQRSELKNIIREQVSLTS